MSEWSTGQVILFSLITLVLIGLGKFVTLMIENFPKVKAELEAQQPVEHAAKKFLPPSVKQDGTVNFTHCSNEVYGTMDGKEIYAFYKDDHDYYWVYEGIHPDPKSYVQRPEDPIVRIFVGKIMYMADLVYEEE